MRIFVDNIFTEVYFNERLAITLKTNQIETGAISLVSRNRYGFRDAVDVDSIKAYTMSSIWTTPEEISKQVQEDKAREQAQQDR